LGLQEGEAPRIKPVEIIIIIIKLTGPWGYREVRLPE